MQPPSIEMADAAAALYRQQVLEHGREPRWAGRLAGPARRARASNALCGDDVEISLRLDARGAISELLHASQGCLLCVASASLMAGHVQGLDAAAVAACRDALQARLREPDARGGADPFPALAGAAPYAARHRCVLLPWDTLLAALAAPEREAAA